MQTARHHSSLHQPLPNMLGNTQLSLAVGSLQRVFMPV